MMLSTAPEKFLDIFLLLSFFKFFLIFKLFAPLILIFVTYYYLAKKDSIFKAKFIYIYIHIFIYIYIYYNFVIDFVLYF